MINFESMSKELLTDKQHTYLHGDTNEEEEIELQQANLDLIELIHGCNIVVSYY